jgi:hypothetical protein
VFHGFVHRLGFRHDEQRARTRERERQSRTGSLRAREWRDQHVSLGALLRGAFARIGADPSRRPPIEDDLGYALYRSVEGTNLALSASTATRFSFHDEPVHIDHDVARASFETWIGEQLGAIAASVDRLLGSTGIAPSAVDRVFMTGGSSFVPAVRRIFECRFGAAKLSDGDELTGVALGLASVARDRLQ